MILSTAINFVSAIRKMPSINDKVEYINRFVDENGQDAKDFLKVMFDNSIVLNLNKNTFKKYDKYVDKKLMYEYDSLIDLFEYLHAKESINDYDRKLVCSYIESYRDDEDIFFEEDQYIAFDIFSKNPRMGADYKIVNKALGYNLINNYEVQLCEPKIKSIPRNCFVERKIDGIRCLAEIMIGEVVLKTRNGKLIKGFDEVEKELLKYSLSDNFFQTHPKGVVFDGELETDDDFTETTKQLFRKSNNKPAKYFVFDCISYNEFYNKTCTKTLSQRKLNMAYSLARFASKEFVDELPTELITNASMTLINEMCEKFVADGYEGVIIKDAMSHYTYSRNHNWQKLKLMQTVDCKIVEMVEGEGKYEGLLGAIVINIRGTEVGSGFTDDQRVEMWHNKSNYLGKTVEVQFQDYIPESGKLRFPTFKKFRPDK